MIAHALRLLLPAFLFVGLLSPAPAASADHGGDGTLVVRVVDGDTIEVAGGRRVRLLGIDAPERGAALWDAAGARLRELAGGRRVSLEACVEKDPYGRTLATVRAGEVNVNAMLLREGLALPLLIPPCGTPVAGEVIRAAAGGALSGAGIYALPAYRVVPHERSADHIGERAVVRGRVRGIFRGPKAWHLNFGEDWRTDFTAVIFREGQKRFRELGIDPGGYVGSEVLVIGKLKRYNGPEIIVRGPDQVLPISGAAGTDR